MIELRTDEELAALLLADVQQRVEEVRRLNTAPVTLNVPLPRRLDLLLCAARELHRRILSVTRKQGRNVTANCGIPTLAAEGV